MSLEFEEATKTYPTCNQECPRAELGQIVTPGVHRTARVILDKEARRSNQALPYYHPAVQEHVDSARRAIDELPSTMVNDNGQVFSAEQFVIAHMACGALIGTEIEPGRNFCNTLCFSKESDMVVTKSE